VGAVNILQGLRIEREVMEVRGKLMMVVVFLLLASVLSPVTAKSIGPTKAQRNPNIILQDGETVLLTPGGVQHEWYDTAGWMDFIHILNASKVDWGDRVPSLSLAELRTIMTYPEVALEFENKWGYVSQSVLFDLLKLFYPEDMAWAIASMWPEGMYLMFVNVGK
jgi:hypothetical protein